MLSILSGLTHLKALADIGKRSDSAYHPRSATIVLTNHPGESELVRLSSLLNDGEHQYEFKLTLLGGGAGCFRVVITGEPYHKFLDFMTSHQLLEALAEMGCSVVISNDRGCSIPVQRMFDSNAAQRVDFAVITPLLEEFKPIRGMLKAASREESRLNVDDCPTMYYKYDLLCDAGRTRSVVACHMPRIGNDIAAITTLGVIRDWNPSHIVLCGIAGGLNRDETRLGDVIIADDVFRYDRRRKELNGVTEWSPTSYPTDRRLLSQIQALLLEDEVMEAWSTDCLATFDGNLPEPTVHIGHIACGDAVVDSTELRDEIRCMNRHLLAVEMEGGGVCEAILNQGANTRVAIVRGISDYAAGKAATDADDFNWRKYAACNAASFAVKFMQHFETASVVRTYGATASKR